ncbi:alpha-galactosidase [Clostridium estertheticum]|uniref:alpha-galactosidase n=1 Tax=Clostridium estertheticum TaxID=238834 RepID=UPI001C7CCDBC|nr:alpha-galactosidase [Clostridium estertheticum]MBX4260099.1 alpha-galactosidase [Clostridium estertheticum]WLC72111.1 alpha-galactosidase [Clostridium estertheticum]
MLISYFEENKIFHLKAKDTSYIIQIVESKYLQHIYWGKKIRNFKLDYLKPFKGDQLNGFMFAKDNINGFSLDILPQEYPSFGNTDLRSPAYQIQFEDGSTISDLQYLSHEIFSGKKKLRGLPNTYVEKNEEAQTLEITLKDELSGLLVVLSYTVYKDYDVITRSSKIINSSHKDLKVLRALSASVDFSDDNFDLLQLSGAWSRERSIIKRALVSGNQSIESRRGASSPQQNPFIALMRKDADEDKGEVYGINLVYSGNFLANVEVCQYGTTRVQIGINPFDFSWLLKPGEDFQTPEVVMVYSDSGLGKMSQTFHNLYRKRLCRGNYRDKERPILINNWEATYFDFTEESIKNIAREAKKLGIELFVLDDGWFGNRNDDTTSLGDWYVNKEKLPNGLKKLSKDINEIGLKFGLWFEPEMVSENSNLYRAHPDWCIHVKGRERSLGRNQLVLDFSRTEVCDAIIEMLSENLSTYNISYVKWDMNRFMSEVGSATLDANRQRETAHRYMLGLYRVMEELTTKFPEVLFESCASGGGRFDPGMLYYMPQTWTSDDTDAIERLKIQYGTSLVYPSITMGAHVSAVPNHQVHRITPLETRGNVAMGGNFGYELDVIKMTDEEKQTVKKQISDYKEIRHIVQFGDFYRLISPFENNDAAWMFISENKEDVVVSYFKKLAECNIKLKVLKFKGLDPEMNYRVIGTDEVYGGDELMYAGMVIPELKGDFTSYVWRLKKTL